MNRIRAFLDYIGARFIVAVDPQPSPSWLDNMDRGTVPLTDEDSLMAIAQAAGVMAEPLPRRYADLADELTYLRANGLPIDGDLVSAIKHAEQQTPEDVTAEFVAMQRGKR